MAAIMFTDLAGFTALAHTDEAQALEAVDATQRVVQPIVREHHGRTVKSTGDGLLLEFPSARGAVLCALDVQSQLRSVKGAPAARALAMRIGVHSGDVEERGRDILGDSVNIASRLEALAPPGGLCISRTVLDQVRSSVPLEAELVRGRPLKGLGTTVEAYRVFPRSAHPGPTLASVPRLAVLPLANISPDPADAYIAAGLTEELISTLAQVAGLRVIARTSVMQYQSDPRPISEVARELQVESVLEGSVRRSAEDLRVTLQLIDGASQEHVWSRTYDRRLKDVLQFQREIAADVSSRFRATLPSEPHVRQRPVADPSSASHLAYLRGTTALRDGTAAGVRRALREFGRAIRLDGRNARAYCGLAEARITRWYYRVHEGKTRFRDDWTGLIEEALKIDPNLAEAHSSLGGVLVSFRRDWKGGEAEFRQALRTDPGRADAHVGLGATSEALGRLDEAARQFQIAHELDPLSLEVAQCELQNAIWRRKYSLAEAHLRRLTMLEGRRRVDGFSSLGFELMLSDVRGDRRRLQRAFQRAVRLARTPARRMEIALAVASHRHDARAFHRLVPKARRLMAPERLSVNLAAGYAQLREMDEAYFWLRESIKDPGVALAWWRYDPRFGNVRRDPRWAGFLRESLQPMPDGPPSRPQ